MNRTSPPIVLLIAALAALVVVGCGGGDSEGGDEAVRGAGDPVRSGAADLRGSLTVGLREQIELIGIATSAQLADGEESESYRAVLEVIGQNSESLAETVGRAYGEESADQFLEDWRLRNDLLADYTAASAAGDRRAMRLAARQIKSHQDTLSTLIAGLTPNLTASAVSDGLSRPTERLLGAIDMSASQGSEASLALQPTLAATSDFAAVLTDAIVVQFPNQFRGDPDSDASALRAALTARLQRHVYGTFVAVDAVLRGGGDRRTESAITATAELDANATALARLIGRNYGTRTGQRFLGLWRQQIDSLLDFTLARATRNADKLERAKRDLEDFRRDMGVLVAGVNPNLTDEAVADQLIDQVSPVLEVIDLAVAGDLAVYEQLREAASAVPDTAVFFGSAISQQFPNRFGG